VKGAVVTLRGQVERAGTIQLVQTCVAEIDGVAGVDTSQLTARSTA
jgi:hypothetical protein